ncbi:MULTISPECIES: dethiobiotin synthase [Nocardioides]|uniref:ATP-dependent dethiobiotin synthetase BioD n=1 Tax=Nocardioides vastitatis TaxID=2568655 RepID=A0ABW0ZGQ1_9ACTN|nr:dethiobiotin synthase [Nocardioides sp.]THI97739.1 ATP-dependent dethiobiotin synthetase BioD [Nocardioides sp.]
MTRVVVVTGTDTGVGKTIAVAALAAVGPGRVTVLKPVQTGVGGADPDVPDAETVHRLTGRAARQLTALDEPLAPDVAARRQAVPIPPVGDYVDHVRALAEDHDVVIVEGAGGLLVRLDQDGGTLLDLAADLAAELPAGAAVEVVIVTRAGLGTLNHTELSVAALRARGLEPVGLVIGSWPDSPGLAEECNLQDLPRVTGVPVLAVLPQGAGALDREDFLALAPTWFR